MHPRTPRSTLFPYTTLFRSQARVMEAGRARTPIIVLSADATVEARQEAERAGAFAFLTKPVVVPSRSEEHTSELQSHVNLVCRLLLEKKKKTRCTEVA